MNFAIFFMFSSTHVMSVTKRFKEIYEMTIAVDKIIFFTPTKKKFM